MSSFDIFYMCIARNTTAVKMKGLTCI